MPCEHRYSLDSSTVEGNDVIYSCDKKPEYLCVNYHRSSERVEKGIWIISRDEEAYRFYCAYDNKNKSDEYPGLWHVESDNCYVGSLKELISFFPAPVNKSDPWHGYPFTFSRASPRDRIRALKTVTERLLLTGKISLARAKKIRQGDL